MSRRATSSLGIRATYDKPETVHKYKVEPEVIRLWSVVSLARVVVIKKTGRVVAIYTLAILTRLLLDLNIKSQVVHEISIKLTS